MHLHEDLGVLRMHRSVLIAMKDDKGHRAAHAYRISRGAQLGRAGAHPHCRHRRKGFVGDAERQAGMNSSRRVKVGVGDRKIDRHRGTRRHSGDENPRRVDLVRCHHLARDACDDGGFAGIAELIRRPKPVPASEHIGTGSLLGIHDDMTAAFSGEIHFGAERKVVGVLACAVKHDDQRCSCAVIARWHVDLEFMHARGVGKSAGEPLRARLQRAFGFIA